MRFFRMIRRIVCLAAALLIFASACMAEGTYEIGTEGLDLTETISVHYPVISGGTDETLTGQINAMIREKCRIEYYLTRTVALLSGGSLETDWRGGILGDVFSCAVSAAGAVENSRPTYEWTSVSVDLRDGHEITFAELFSDDEAARNIIETYLEETVEPDLSAYLQSGEVLPLPESFWLEQTGLTLLYPVEQLSTLSDRAGDVRIGWNVLKDVLDMSEDSIPVRIGLQDAAVLTAQGAEKLRAAAAEGMMTDIPAKIGDRIQELTDRYHQRTDWDGIENGRLFALEGGCFRGVYLLTDNLTKGWENSVVQGIRMDQGCFWGLCPGETPREEWLNVLGEPDGTAEVSEENAEANRLTPGICDYYHCGSNLLQLYSDGNGMLISVILTE